jgi:hypothetical protein
MMPLWPSNIFQHTMLLHNTFSPHLTVDATVIGLEMTKLLYGE